MSLVRQFKQRWKNRSTPTTRQESLPNGNDQENDHFSYDLLPEEPLTIRLFQIDSPPDDEGVINCSFIQLVLDETYRDGILVDNTREEYTALSYAWEPKYPLGEISLNGDRMQVGRNLWDFLYQLSVRGPMSFSPWLWADAICIDQRNNKEKGFQVASMGRIYRSAGALLLWLGIGDKETDFALNIVSRLPQRKFPQNDFPSNLFVATCAFAAVLRRRYWRRRWVLHEVESRRHYPGAHSVLCGTKEVGLEQIRLFSYEATELMAQIRHSNYTLLPTAMSQNDLVEFKDNARIISQFRDHISDSHNYPELPVGGSRKFLPSLLYVYRNSECSTALDRIYALLPMCQEESFIFPDYTFGLFEVFWQLCGFNNTSVDRKDHEEWQRLEYHIHLAEELLRTWEHETTLKRSLLENAMEDRATTRVWLKGYRGVDLITAVAITTTKHSMRRATIQATITTERDEGQSQGSSYEIRDSKGSEHRLPMVGDIVLKARSLSNLLIFLRKDPTEPHIYRFLCLLLDDSTQQLRRGGDRVARTDELLKRAFHESCFKDFVLAKNCFICPSCSGSDRDLENNEMRLCCSEVSTSKATFLALTLSASWETVPVVPNARTFSPIYP